MSRIIANIDPDLHRKLKALAQEQNEKGEGEPFDRAVEIVLARGLGTENQKPQIGIWTLVSPNGQRIEAETPLKCVKKEQELRIPPEVALGRLTSFLNQCDLCEESDAEHILGGGTPAELRVCLTCKNTIFGYEVKSIFEGEKSG